jgi:hypothetical protein
MAGVEFMQNTCVHLACGSRYLLKLVTPLTPDGCRVKR